MEDEGRYQYMSNFRTVLEALVFIEKEVDKSKGWYSKGSFLITQPING